MNPISLYIITGKEAEKILHARKAKVLISLDLGKTNAEITIEKKHALIGNNKIPLKDFKKVKDKGCYYADANLLKKLAFFSDETNFYYKIVPTKDWPTVTLSSTPMHRHTNISPKEDTLLKIREISPVAGNVLDTCCGLGYTAIEAARHADRVVTFEADKNMIEMQRLNPWSAGIFGNEKIEIRNEDVFEAIKGLATGFFSRIIHDPPTVKYSTLLYSGNFYSQLYRVLAKNGVLYHYAPKPGKMKDKVFYTGMVKRLKHAGFSNVEYHEASSGVRAVKW